MPIIIANTMQVCAVNAIHDSGTIDSQKWLPPDLL